MNSRFTLRASSLSNAIFLCLVISIFCGCLVMVSHYQNMINARFLDQENLIHNNASGLNYFLNHIEDFETNNELKVDIFGNDEIVTGKLQHWGLYNILTVTSRTGKDSLTQSVLIGQESKGDGLALYATNYDKKLRLSGKVDILGTSKIPDSRFEPFYINGQAGNAISTKGIKTSSDKRFPKLTINLNLEPLNQNIATINNNQLVNEFNQVAKRIDVSNIPILNNFNIKGNFVLVSKNSLTISKNTNIEDVLIVAPKVTVESGFEGTMQIISTKEVVLQDNVTLKYPSSIYVKNDRDSVSVKINNNVRFFGDIIVNGETYDASKQRLLTIAETATIVGSIYNFGKTQLQGKIIGKVYSDRFFLNTKSSYYENIILNASINRDSLPENFMQVPLFNNKVKTRYGIIKKL